MAYRPLSEEEYESFNEQYEKASLNIEDREGKMSEVAEEIEKDMMLLGLVGIEDKLQKGTSLFRIDIRFSRSILIVFFVFLSLFLSSF